MVADPGARLPPSVEAALTSTDPAPLSPGTSLVLPTSGSTGAPRAVVLVGGGPLAPERANEARAQGVRLVQSYGMMETCGGYVYDGRPLDGVEIDAQHVDGDSGRIRLRGPMRATSHLGSDPDDSAHFTPDGWFVTDDLEHFTPDGSLEVLGRVDAMINTGGVKVDPAVVEALLRDHPTVIDATALAAADAEWGERVIAIVVRDDARVNPSG